VISGEFRVNSDNTLPNAGGDEGVQASRVSGTIRRWSPSPGDLRLQPGDRFEIPEIGGAVVEVVSPDRFGVESGRWLLEEGSA
jgi:hypothetical protein